MVSINIKGLFTGSNSYIKTWNVLFGLCASVLRTIMSPFTKGFFLSLLAFFFCWLFRFHPNRWLHYMSLKHPKLPLYILFVALKTLAHSLWPISYLTAVLETCRDNLMKQWWLWFFRRQVNERLPSPGETSRGPLKWRRPLSESLFNIIYMHYI